MAGQRLNALSVLDLTVLNDGQTSAEALQTTEALAIAADRLGYQRFWVAEHHNMATVACTSPSVLIAHLAAKTTQIKVGSGGVMLPNHAPLIVAEQFAMLEALHPGRIDVGIGRAPGTEQETAAVIRRGAPMETVDSFPDDLLALMGLLGDRRIDRGMWERFRATPAATSYPAIFLLGSSGYSAQLAGYLGLPFAFAHHFDTGGTMQAAEIYLQAFEPSAILAEPYLIVTANVLAADTQADADWHAAPGRITALGRRSGRFIRLPSPIDAQAHPDLDRAAALPTSRIVGDQHTVITGLRSLATQTGANELMITSVAFDVEARIRSIELVAEGWEDLSGAPLSGTDRQSAAG